MLPPLSTTEGYRLRHSDDDQVDVMPTPVEGAPKCENLTFKRFEINAGRSKCWEVYAGQTNEQKVDRASRLDPPRVPASFRPHGIVGPNCAKDDGRHGPRQFCPDCMAARRRFVGDVQAAGELFDGALYDHRWRRAAWELQGRPTAATAACGGTGAGVESDPRRANSVEAAAGADTVSFASDGDFVELAVDSGCAIALSESDPVRRLWGYGCRSTLNVQRKFQRSTEFGGMGKVYTIVLVLGLVIGGVLKADVVPGLEKKLVDAINAAINAM